VSELADQIKLILPEAWPDYEVTIKRSELNSILRTAVHQGAELVLEQARKSKFTLPQNRVTIVVVELERLKRFVGGKDGE